MLGGMEVWKSKENVLGKGCVALGWWLRPRKVWKKWQEKGVVLIGRYWLGVMYGLKGESATEGRKKGWLGLSSVKDGCLSEELKKKKEKKRKVLIDNKGWLRWISIIGNKKKG